MKTAAEILEKYYPNSFGKGADVFKAMEEYASQFSKELPSDDCDNCSKAPYNEKGYPQEFVEWIGLEGVELRYYDEIPIWIYYKRNTIEPLVKFNTIPELYTYWQNEINNHK